MNEELLEITGDEVTQYYWDNCREEKMMIQYCYSCKRFQYPPNLVCRNCLSNDIGWKESKGTGEIYSYSVVHRAPLKFFEKYVPYVVALVKLDENVMVESWIIGVDLQDDSALKIGARVKLSFKDFHSYKLPVFKL